MESSCAGHSSAMRATHFALPLVFGLAACVTDVELGSNRTGLAAPTPRHVGMAGSLCTPVVVSPIKIVIALDENKEPSWAGVS